MSLFNNIVRRVSFVPADFYPVKSGEKPGSLIYANAWITDRIIMEQMMLEVNADDFKVRPSYGYFLCDSVGNPTMYLGSNLYRSVFNPVDHKTGEEIDLHKPVYLISDIE